jgi:hypothetical protein
MQTNDTCSRFLHINYNHGFCKQAITMSFHSLFNDTNPNKTPKAMKLLLLSDYQDRRPIRYDHLDRRHLKLTKNVNASADSESAELLSDYYPLDDAIESCYDSDSCSSDVSSTLLTNDYCVFIDSDDKLDDTDKQFEEIETPSAVPQENIDDDCSNILVHYENIKTCIASNLVCQLCVKDK